MLKVSVMNTARTKIRCALFKIRITSAPFGGLLFRGELSSLLIIFSIINRQRFCIIQLRFIDEHYWIKKNSMT